MMSCSVFLCSHVSLDLIKLPDFKKLHNYHWKHTLIILFHLNLNKLSFMHLCRQIESPPQCWKMLMNLSDVPVTTNNNMNCQNAFVTAHIVKISCVHSDAGHPKSPNSTGNKKGPYGIHVSSPPWSTQADFPSGVGKRISGCQTLLVPCGY